MATRVLRLVLVFALLLPGYFSAAEANLDDQPFKNYLPLISAVNVPSTADCVLVYQDPKDGTSIEKGKAFDVRWTLRNTGTDTWSADIVKIRFLSGDRMHSGNDQRDLPYDVTPGGMLDLVVSMTAPATAGVYTSNWSLMNAEKSICNFYVQIHVP